MGVTTLWDLIKGTTESNTTTQSYSKHSLNTYNGYKQYPTLAIDISIWILEGVMLTKSLQSKNVTISSDQYVYIIFSRTLKLLQHNYKLVFIFDGKAPKNKQSSHTRTKATGNEYVYGTRHSSDYFNRLYKKLKPILLNLNCQIIELQVGESEAYAAQLYKNNTVNAVVTSDADCLLFGATNVMRNFNTKRDECDVYDANTVLNKLQIGHNQLIVLAILLKSDYSNGVKDMGKMKCLKFVQLFDNDTIIDKLRMLLCEDNAKQQSHIEFDELDDDTIKDWCSDRGILYKKTARKKQIKYLNKLQDLLNNDLQPVNEFYIRNRDRFVQAFDIHTFNSILHDYTDPTFIVKPNKQLHIHELIDLNTLFEDRFEYHISFNRIKQPLIALYCTQLLYELAHNQINLISDSEKLYFVPTTINGINTKQGQKQCHVTWKMTAYGISKLSAYMKDDTDTYETLHSTPVKTKQNDVITVDSQNSDLINIDSQNDIINIDSQNSDIIDLLNIDEDDISSTLVEIGSEIQIDTAELDPDSDTSNDSGTDSDVDKSHDNTMQSVILFDHEELVKLALPGLYQSYIDAKALMKKDKEITKQQIKEQVKQAKKAAKQDTKQQKLNFKQVKRDEMFANAINQINKSEVVQTALKYDGDIKVDKISSDTAKLVAQYTAAADLISPQPPKGIKAFFKESKNDKFILDTTTETSKTEPRRISTVNLISSDKKPLTPTKRRSPGKSNKHSKKKSNTTQRSLHDALNQSVDTNENLDDSVIILDP